MMCPSMNLLMQPLGSARKITPIFEVRGRGLSVALDPEAPQITLPSRPRT
jgi:hypothetical protein